MNELAHPPFAVPVRFEPGLEVPEADEQETLVELAATMRSISETTYRDSGHALRGAHAKSHGLLRGEMTVLDGLPETLRQGMFAQPGTYQIVMRLSTAPGDILPDNISTPRGMAIKIVGVEGARLPGSENDITQDFVLVNGPAFLVSNAKAFLANVKPLAASTDKAEGLKKAASAVLRGAEKIVEAFGGESAKIKSLGGHPETHILGETFHSQVPVRYGDYVAKISVAPVAAALTALTDAPLDLNRENNGLRAAVVEFFSRQAAEWELRVQLCTDLDSMPIEDASAIWPEDRSPPLTVARISVAPQMAWSEERAKAIDDGMSFSPWHGIEAHRPLGSIMRARRLSYDTVAKYRAQANGRSIDEPHTFDHIPV